MGQGSAATSLPVAVAGRCGAKTRKGTPCAKLAGHRTVHPGEGRCYLHGGLQHGDARLKAGRYSTVKHERIRELTEQFERDPDPLNIFPELAAARATFVHFIERHEEFTEALLAWHADWQLRRRPLPEDLLLSLEAVVDEWEIAIGEKGLEATETQKGNASAARKFITVLRGQDDATKPRTVLDISESIRHLDTITKMVEREEKKRSANAVSRPDLNRIMHELWRAVEATVGDDEQKQRIRTHWLQIRL
jgi:hypothetical protein